jgi:gentisate 1,2-dioxygenase
VAPGDVAPAHIHSVEKLNADASKLNIWVRTEMNAPAQRAWFTDPGGETGAGQLATGIITPNGTWHDHGNDSDTPVVWIDMLDWPLLEVLDLAWVDLDYRGAGDDRNAKIQNTVHTDGYSSRLYGHGGLKPTFVNHKRGWGHNPDAMIHYRGADVREALHGLRQEKGDPTKGSSSSSSTRRTADQSAARSSTRRSSCVPAKQRCRSARRRAPSWW